MRRRKNPMSDPYKKVCLSLILMQKETFKGNLVVVLDGKYEERGLQLIPQPSRCLIANDLHRLILTDENKSPEKK